MKGLGDIQKLPELLETVIRVLTEMDARLEVVEGNVERQTDLLREIAEQLKRL